MKAVNSFSQECISHQFNGERSSEQINVLSLLQLSQIECEDWVDC